MTISSINADKDPFKTDTFAMGAQTLSNCNIEEKPISGRPSVRGWQCKLVKECVARSPQQSTCT
jgi:hypothetical protein